MSWSGWNPAPWHQESPTWRPYANQPHLGPIRGPNRNGWSNHMSDPYFTRSQQAQSHMVNYERNKMHMFHQPSTSMQAPPRKMINNPPPMSDFARQTLINNAHVPGLRTGLQLRNMMQQRKLTREMTAKNKENPKNGGLLNVLSTVSSERIELKWSTVMVKIPETAKFVLHFERLKTKIICTTEYPWTCQSAELPVIAGESYKITLECRKENMVLASWSKVLRAEFNYTELQRLIQKCYNFLRRGPNSEAQMHEFGVVYRCKPKVYWDEIHHYGNDVMQKYIKDDNGQPGNLINGKINGLFFSARLLPDMTLPTCSPFGNVRMVINAFTILNPDVHNFYFADFYCNKNIHYVTVVICVKESETDRYCCDRLIKLNPISNPFVKLIPPMDRFGQWRFYINYTLWVELYYTEDIELNMGQFSAIMATGAGTSKIGGLPNNKQCTLCNLYPTGRTKLSKGEKLPVASVDLDSTMACILREDSGADEDVADVICYLVDRIEEQNLGLEEFTQKVDRELVESVEKMNIAVRKGAKKKEEEGVLERIARNLTDFVEGFNRRRDNLIQEVKKLKNE